MKNNMKWLALGALLLLFALLAVSCIGGADYSLFKPSPESMVEGASIVYVGEMPCMIFIGTTGGGEDTFSWGSCDWSKYDDTLPARFGMEVIRLTPKP